MKLDRKFLDAFHRLGAKPGEEYGAPVAKKLSLVVRPAIIARPRKTLVWGDWSNIEARVLPWLAASDGAEAKLDIFRAIDKDPTLPDVYMRTAADLLDEDADQLWADYSRKDDSKAYKHAYDVRQSHGKVPELSLGFGGGLGALQAMATNYGVYLDSKTAQRVVDSWREANQWARDFWGTHNRHGSTGLWGAVNSAIENPDTPFQAGRIICVYDPRYLAGTLFIVLPCGRPLTYPNIKWGHRVVKDTKTKQDKDIYDLSFVKGYGRSGLWYGKLCLAGDTKVATDRGWVPLTDVRVSDRVWDGVEWVSHQGLLYQGVKFTVPLDGVRMTPDHRVLTEDGWREAQVCEGLHRADFRQPYGRAARLAGKAREAVALGRALCLWIGAGVPVGWVGAAEQRAIAEVVRLRNARSDQRREQDARDDLASGLRGMAVDARSLPAADAPGVGELRRPWHQGVRAVAIIRELLGRYGAYLRARLDTGAIGQRGRVRPAKLHLGDLPRAGVEPAHLSAVEHDGAFPADGYKPHDAALSMAPEPVYDLFRAGPRSRFMVLGATGPLIVHNCENVTQAGAASVLRRTLRKLENDWTPVREGGHSRYVDFMPVVMHTHDEVVTEPLECYSSEAAHALELLMETNEEWDEGLPLKAEITTNWYYTKGKF